MTFDHTPPGEGKCRLTACPISLKRRGLSAQRTCCCSVCELKIKRRYFFSNSQKKRKENECCKETTCLPAVFADFSLVVDHYSTAPVGRPPPKPPDWAAGPTACLPTPGQNVTCDLCPCDTHRRSVAPTFSPSRPQYCLRYTASPMALQTGSARSK